MDAVNTDEDILRLPEEPPIGSIVRVPNGDEYTRTGSGWYHPRLASHIRWGLVMDNASGEVVVVRRGKEFPRSLFVYAEDWYWFREQSGDYYSCEETIIRRCDEKDHRFKDDPVWLRVVPLDEWLRVVIEYEAIKNDPDRSMGAGRLFKAIGKLVEATAKLPSQER